jgi:hypothetical protein
MEMTGNVFHCLATEHTKLYYMSGLRGFWHAQAQMQFAIDTFALEYFAYYRCNV